MPWERDPKELPDNYQQALAKLINTERRLKRNLEHADVYQSRIDDLVERGCARKLTADEKKSHGGPVHYISHHAVVRPEKKTTPCRVVFNSAAKYKGYVLNDYLMKGPDLLNSMLVVMLKFREKAVGYVGDVSKM